MRKLLPMPSSCWQQPNEIFMMSAVASALRRCPMNIVILAVHALVYRLLIAGPPYLVGEWTRSRARVLEKPSFGSRVSSAGPRIWRHCSSEIGIAPMGYTRAGSSTSSKALYASCGLRCELVIFIAHFFYFSYILST